MTVTTVLPEAGRKGSVLPEAGKNSIRLPGGSFAAYVARARSQGALVVQPRMGFCDPAQMRRGLLATRGAGPTVAGTITLDSYTRVGDYASAGQALNRGVPLNGYPLINHGPAVTRRLLAGLRDSGFPVQIRHGSADPHDIVGSLIDAGLDATEGGPVSYCLPYSRLPLRDAVRCWARSCELFAGAGGTGAQPHMESFGGCMLGQLCPPSLLIAITVLEAMFFRQHGLRSVSLSFAQQTHPDQDAEALRALRILAAELLAGLDWHVVVYTYMGVYPASREGALRLLGDSAALAVRGGAERLIVKTPAEAFRIPAIEENVESLQYAAAAATAAAAAGPAPPPADTGVLAEARALIGATLELSPDVGTALLAAFRRGYLDVPYCLHPDNAGAARSRIDASGRLAWAAAGAMPIAPPPGGPGRHRFTSFELLAALSHVRNSYDAGHRPGPIGALPAAGPGGLPTYTDGDDG